MDARHFDHLTRMLSRLSARRGLLRLLTTLPVLAGLAALLDPGESDAAGRRKRRKKRHKHAQNKRKGGRKRKCKARSRARTCAGKCGLVKNTCKKRVDCGSCACEPPCPVCQICNDAPRACVPDPVQQGAPCGEPGQVCQADGACACNGSSCPACRACGSDGLCAASCNGTGCCDGTSCQPGTTDAACGTGGNACALCSGGNSCQSGSCGCTPLTICPAPFDCGEIDNGCGGMLSCGTCSNPTPVCASNVCTACSAANLCPAGQLCDAGSCQACTVTCPGGSCGGAALQTALGGGGTVYACPGRYTGNFTLGASVTLIGAGEGTDPASNTILDAAGSGRVVLVNSGITAALQGLRITGGSAVGGGGFDNSGALSLTACTVAQNDAGGGAGGGIINSAPGTVTLTDCTVTDNRADIGAGIRQNSSGAITLDNTVVSQNVSGGSGGGIDVNLGTVNITNGSAITDENSAVSDGGGIFVSQLGTVIFDSSSSVTGNTAASGGGIFLVAGGTVTLNGATVEDNIPDDCVGLVC